MRLWRFLDQFRTCFGNIFLRIDQHILCKLRRFPRTLTGSILVIFELTFGRALAGTKQDSCYHRTWDQARYLLSPHVGPSTISIAASNQDCLIQLALLYTPEQLRIEGMVRSLLHHYLLRPGHATPRRKQQRLVRNTPPDNSRTQEPLSRSGGPPPSL